MNLDARLAELVAAGVPFTADDLTDSGHWAVDPYHAPNGAQSAVGACFRRAHARGLIEPTGTVVKSKAPHRKGGMIRVWQPTQGALDL